MVNAFDAQMLALEQRSRSSQMREHAHTPAQTEGEMVQDVLLKSAWTTAQVAGKLYGQELAQANEVERQRAPNAAAYQAAFDEKIRPKAMLNMLFDPIGSANLLSSAGPAAELISIHEQKNLEKLNERLALHEMSFALSHSDNPEQFNRISEKIVSRVREEQGLTPEFNANYESLRRQSDIYFTWKSARGDAIETQTVNQSIRNILNNAAVEGVSAADLNKSIKDFANDIMPLMRKNRRSEAYRKVVGGVIGSTSNAKAASELLFTHGNLFSPQEKQRLNQQILANAAAAKNLKVADKKNVDNLAQYSLDHGQTWEYVHIPLPKNLAKFNDFLAANKAKMLENGLGIGPSAYQALSAQIEDAEIQSQLRRTASTLAQEYSKDFFTTVKQEENINAAQKQQLNTVVFNMPILNPETREIINAEPMITSLSTATNLFSELKSTYFPDDDAIQNMLPESARSAYNLLYKKLDSVQQNQFLKFAAQGLASTQANIQGMWPHRQLARIANDPSVAIWSILNKEFAPNIAQSAWESKILASSPDKSSRSTRQDFEILKSKIKNQLKIDGIELEELSPYIGLRTDGQYRRDPNETDVFLYIRKKTIWNNKLEGLILPGTATGIEDAYGQIVDQLKKMPFSEKITVWDKIGSTYFDSSSGLSYQLKLVNLPGTFLQFQLVRIPLNGGLPQPVRNGLVTIKPS